MPPLRTAGVALGLPPGTACPSLPARELAGQTTLSWGSYQWAQPWPGRSGSRGTGPDCGHWQLKASHAHLKGKLLPAWASWGPWATQPLPSLLAPAPTDPCGHCPCDPPSHGCGGSNQSLPPSWAPYSVHFPATWGSPCCLGPQAPWPRTSWDPRATGCSGRSQVGLAGACALLSCCPSPLCPGMGTRRQ